MMHMTFYWGRQVTLLFDFWMTDSWLSYGLTLLAALLFSVFYQYMEDRRFRFKLLSLNSKASSISQHNTIHAPLLLTAAERWSPARFAEALLFGVNSAIGYLLMLAVMSFNGGVFIAVIVGLALGHLLFRSGNEGGGGVVVENPCACA